MDIQPDKMPVPASQPAKKTPQKKWPIVGKFLADVGRFLLNNKKAGQEIKEDVLKLEKHRQEEKQAEEREQARQTEAERAKKAAAEAKLKQQLFETKRQEAAKFRAQREKLEHERQAAVSRLLRQQEHAKSQELKMKLGESVKAGKPKTGGKWWSWGKRHQPLVAAPAPSQPASGTVKDKQKAASHLREERLKLASQSLRQDIENRPWQSYGVVSTNLVREQRNLFFNWQSKILALVLFCALAALVALLAYGFLLVWERDRLNSNQYIFDNLDSINQQIAKQKPYLEEILNFNDRLLFVDYLLDNHIYWTNIFKFLEDYTINDVYYSKFSGDLSGRYLLPSVAKDYRSIYVQLKVLQQSGKTTSADSGAAAASTPGATSLPGASASTAGATSTPQRIKFDLNLAVERSLFLK